MHFDSDFFIFHVDDLSCKVHERVSIACFGDFLDVVSFEERLSFVIVHVHKVVDGFDAGFLFDGFGKFFIHDLEESGIGDPDALNEHLTELHCQDNWFEESQR